MREKLYKKIGGFWYTMVSAILVSVAGASIGFTPFVVTSAFYIVGLVMLQYTALRADAYESMYREESKDNVRLRSMLIEMKVENYRKEVR